MSKIKKGLNLHKLFLLLKNYNEMKRSFMTI